MPGSVQGDIAVLLLDDHRVFAESLALALDAQSDMRCAAVAHTVADGVELAERVPFTAALIDLQLPDGSGLTAIAEITGRHPGTAVIALTAHRRAHLERDARRAGAAGFLGKDAGLADILGSIRTTVAHGALGIVEPLPDTTAEHHITPREQDVLGSLARGLDATAIASSMGISLHTARGHIRSIMAKLDARTQLHAVVVAQRRGLVSVGL